MNQTMDHAEYQKWLDRTGQTILDNDYATYRNNIALPLTLITSDGTAVIEDEVTLNELFQSYLNMFQTFHVTDMIRLCSSVQKLDDDIMRATYTTHVMREGQRLFEPFVSDMTLRRDHGQWRAVSIANNLTNNRWPVPIPRRSETTIRKPTERLQ